MFQRTKSERFIRSSKRRPCPICGRTKDADCSWAEDGSVVVCHHPVNLSPQVDSCGEFIFVGNTSDDRAAVLCHDQLRGGY